MESLDRTPTAYLLWRDLNVFEVESSSSPRPLSSFGTVPANESPTSAGSVEVDLGGRHGKPGQHPLWGEVNAINEAGCE
jgi:hypothetical protein